MKLDIKSIVTKLQPVQQFLKRYCVFIFIMVMLSIFGFLVYRINQFDRIEPSEDTVSEKLQKVQRPRIDEGVLDKMQQLRGQNIQVQSLFDQARNNPFSE